MVRSKSLISKRVGKTPAASRRYNMEEVALAAKVSVATVSRTLAMPDVVAPETRERVHDAIRRLGYTPNIQARSLRTSRTNVIVALVPEHLESFLRGHPWHRAGRAREGYSVLLGDTQYSLDREQVYADLIGTRQADGLITLMPHIPKIAVADRLPLVNACEYVADRSITSVYVNNVAERRKPLTIY